MATTTKFKCIYVCKQRFLVSFYEKQKCSRGRGQFCPDQKIVKGKKFLNVLMNIIPNRRVQIRIFTIYHPPLLTENISLLNRQHLMSRIVLIIILAQIIITIIIDYPQTDGNLKNSKKLFFNPPQNDPSQVSTGYYHFH